MPNTPAPIHYNSYNAFLRQRFGGRCVKLSLDLGVPCPHRKNHPPGCIYCRPGVIMADRISALGSITNQINAGVLSLGARYKTDLFLAYFQNETATAGDTQWLLDQYNEAIVHPKVKGVIISTRPDMVTEHLLDILHGKAFRKPIFLEFGLQSSHDRTLETINRGHDLQTFEDAVRMAAKREFRVCAHVILGLPGETREMMVDTFRYLGKQPIDSIKIHHLQIYEKTALEEKWWRGELTLFERFEDYLPVLVDCLEVLPWRVKVQRLVADAPRTYLLAPQWNLTKNEIIQSVEEEFKKRKTKQGVYAKPLSPDAPTPSFLA